jgi:rubrerythrin
MILSPKNNKNLLKTIVEFAYAEYGSAIEMCVAAKKTKFAKLKIFFINHALDEYKHASLILKILDNQIKLGIGDFDKEYRFNPQNVITKGYVNKDRFLIEKLKLKTFIEFVYLNSFLAQKNFSELSKKITDIDSLKIIKSIIKDEQEHENSSLVNLQQIKNDNNKCCKYYEFKFSKNINKIAIYRERLKNRFKVLYLENFNFLNKIFDPFSNLLILLFGKLVNFIIIKDEKYKNLIQDDGQSILI